MTNLLKQLYRDENGFIVSSEIVLICTIAVLGMIVGLSSVSYAVNHELDDVARGFESVNQDYDSYYGGYKGKSKDRKQATIISAAPEPEKGK